MARYRFKTEEEFKADGRWHRGCNTPTGWGLGHLNYLLGTEVPAEHTYSCDAKKDLFIGGEQLSSCSYVLMSKYEIIESIDKAKPVSNFVIHPVKEFKF